MTVRSFSLFYFLLLLLLFPACARRDAERESRSSLEVAADCSSPTVTIAHGVELRTITCLQDEAIDFYVLRVDTDVNELRATMSKESSAVAIAEREDATFAMNANFFGEEGETLGVVVDRERELHPARSTAWQTIFAIDRDGVPSIHHPSQWPTARERMAFAVQAGPRIAEGGKSVEIRDGYEAARAGVCISPAQELTFFASPAERLFTQEEIMILALRSEQRGGLGCRDAMLLDGGHSVQLQIAGRGALIEGDPVPVVIYSIPRER